MGWCSGFVNSRGGMVGTGAFGGRLRRVIILRTGLGPGKIGPRQICASLWQAPVAEKQPVEIRAVWKYKTLVCLVRCGFWRAFGAHSSKKSARAVACCARVASMSAVMVQRAFSMRPRPCGTDWSCGRAKAAPRRKAAAILVAGGGGVAERATDEIRAAGEGFGQACIGQTVRWFALLFGKTSDGKTDILPARQGGAAGLRGVGPVGFHLRDQALPRPCRRVDSWKKTSGSSRGYRLRRASFEQASLLLFGVSLAAETGKAICLRGYQG